MVAARPPRRGRQLALSLSNGRPTISDGFTGHVAGTIRAKRAPEGSHFQKTGWIVQLVNTFGLVAASLRANRLPPKAVRRSDARLQHVDLQFGKGPRMHVQFASAARERLGMRLTLLANLMERGELMHSCLLVMTSQERESFMRVYRCTRLAV